MAKKTIFAISGSTREKSSNLKLIELFASSVPEEYQVIIFNRLDRLPHFNPDLDNEALPAEVVAFRKNIREADGVLICTPEYVFSIPGSLKNAIEWCVSTTVFSGKPLGIITASASGEKGHEELQMIMKTVEAKFTDTTTLLIQGIRGKLDEKGNISDEATQKDFDTLTKSFLDLITKSSFA
jgi:NAD(P)H-dependent FMN reductase